MSPVTALGPVHLLYYYRKLQQAALWCDLAMSEAIWLFLTGTLVPLPFTPNPFVPTDNSSDYNAQVRVRIRQCQRFKLSPSTFHTQFCPGLGATPCYTLTLQACMTLTLLPCPWQCAHFHFHKVSVLCACAHSAVCPIPLIWGISGGHDTVSLCHQCTD